MASALKSRPAAASLAWSPLGPYLAAGSAAGAIDVTFSSASSLEVFAVDLASESPDLAHASPSSPSSSVASAPERFASLAWGTGAGTGGSEAAASGNGNSSSSSYAEGIIAGGLADGSIALWDAASFVSSSASASAASGLPNGGDSSPGPILLARLAKHAGPVSALRFNAGSPNLLASGGSGDGELCIWDVASPTRPTLYPSLRAGAAAAAGGDPSNAAATTPSAAASAGSAPAPAAPPGSEVTSLAWNLKVPHILASAAASGVATVWDLKKQRPVISLKGTMSARGMRASSVAWSPEQATQVAVACEDDAFPVVQLWDLRNATAPVGELSGAAAAGGGHTRGITSVAWCPHDAALLATGGRDGRIVLWDAEAFVPLGETMPLLASSSTSADQSHHHHHQFHHHPHHPHPASVVSSLEWCPTTPGVFAAATLSGAAPGGGLVSVCSLAAFENKQQQQQQEQQQRLQQQQGSHSSHAPHAPSPVSSSSSLARAPAWMRRPAGVSFGYGGRFASFSAVAERNLLTVVADPSSSPSTTTTTITVPPNTIVVSRAPAGIASGLPADAVESLERSLGDGSDRAALAALCDSRAAAASSSTSSTSTSTLFLSSGEPSSSSSSAAAGGGDGGFGGDGEAWSLLRALFDEDPRATLLQRLGFSSSSSSSSSDVTAGAKGEEAAAAATEAAARPPSAVAAAADAAAAPAASSSTSRPATAGSGSGSGTGAGSGAAGAAEVLDGGAASSFFDLLADEQQERQQQQQSRPATAATAAPDSDASADAFGGLSLASSSHELQAPAPAPALAPPPMTEDDERIQRALLAGDYELAVDACLRAGGGVGAAGAGGASSSKGGERDADALVIASLAPPPPPTDDGSVPVSLWARTVAAVLSARGPARPYSRLLSALASGDLASLASSAPLCSWRLTLAALASYAPAEAFAPLADDLARRLAEAAAASAASAEGTSSSSSSSSSSTSPSSSPLSAASAMSHAASCAWVCAGNVDAAVRHWLLSEAASASAF